MTDDRAMTMAEACRYLGIDGSVMGQLVAMGKIRTFTLNGRECVAKDELNRYIRENQTDAEGRRTIMENNE
jgi:excisionase family DNA binding protein